MLPNLFNRISLDISGFHMFTLGIVPFHLNDILPDHNKAFLLGITRAAILCVSSIGLDQASLKAFISSFMSPIISRYLFPGNPCLLSCNSSIFGFHHTKYDTLPSTPITADAHTTTSKTRHCSIGL